MEFFDGRKVAFQSKVDSYGERQNARAPIPQSVTLRAEEVAGNRRAILKQRLDLGGSGRMTAHPEVSQMPWLRTGQRGTIPDRRAYQTTRSI
jgi:hypothetical protein